MRYPNLAGSAAAMLLTLPFVFVGLAWVGREEHRLAKRRAKEQPH